MITPPILVRLPSPPPLFFSQTSLATNCVPPSVQNIAMDVYIIALPIGIILQLKMSLRRRVGVLVIVGSGLSSLVISCIRIPFILSLTTSPDTSYELGKMIILVALEIQFAIVALSMPSLTVLASSWRQRRNKKASLVRNGEIELSDSNGKSSKKSDPRAAMGTITRLERDLPRGDSKEELCRTSMDRMQDP